LAAGRERLRGTELVPTGACVWLGTLAGGMALRALSGQGVAASFVIVAAAVLAVFLFGWRAAYRISRR
ncbi:MAG: DUF3054 family protein, partial [Mycobacteriaceae bacterium]|nr:DUF3054 family protein [Mycobacteriaceae bacterium]